MADGRDMPHDTPTKPYPWLDIFRTFQVALDPRKLLAAAAGILVMSVGWYLLSAIFWYDAPKADAPEYAEASVLAKEFKFKPDGKTELTDDERKAEGAKKYAKDLAQWKVLDDLAGKDGGKLRTMPWYEYRGENPYLVATAIAGSPFSTWTDSIWGYLKGQFPVLAEPLFKLLLPVVKIVDPNASFLTRVYLLLCLVWALATWAFFGGVITRIAAVQLSGKDRVTLPDAVKYVANRYLSYLASPLVPFGIVAVVVIAVTVFGFVALTPILGDVLYGLLLPLVILAGVVMAILLIGLVGYPLMTCTLSVEGSDTFDALSRSYNYVFQAPWHYLWYSLVAVAYGAAVTFFVVFVGSLMIYLGKWAIIQTPLTETTNQEPHYLFVYAPESFGWKELLLKGTPIEVEKKTELRQGRPVVTYPYTKPAEAAKYKDSYQPWNKFGAALSTFWLVLTLLFVIGFGYSFFWSASTMIYLLMRKKVDEVETDEIYLEEDLPAVTAAATPQPPAPANPGVASLPVIQVPPTEVPPAPVSPPPPPADVKVTGPVGALGAPPAEEKK